ncbi:hypothetical protein D3C71_1276790 [compost metagenome]
MDVEAIKQSLKISGPAAGDRRRSYAIFQHKVPAEHPGQKLSECHIAVGVGTPRHRNAGSEFRVAESGQGTGQSGDNEREYERRSSVLGGGHTRHDENAGPYDGADSKGG